MKQFNLSNQNSYFYQIQYKVNSNTEYSWNRIEWVASCHLLYICNSPTAHLDIDGTVGHTEYLHHLCEAFIYSYVQSSTLGIIK